METSLDCVDTRDVLPTNEHKILRQFKRLEGRYGVEDGTEKFKKLVNFSLGLHQPYHNWARYREGYSGVLVKELIRESNLSKNKHFIIDPMCGSGTTLVAAAEIGFDTLGLDVNPFSVALANAKARAYSSTILEQIRSSIKELTSAKSSGGKLKKHEMHNDYYKYFDEQSYKSLLHLKNRIDKIQRKEIRDFLFVAWLCIIEECSQRKKDGNGLATVKRPARDVHQFYSLKATSMLNDLISYPLPKKIIARAYDESALFMKDKVDRFKKMTGKNVGAIIFSPPYANSFDYFESYKMEILFGGFAEDLQDLEEKRRPAIRNYRLSRDENLRNDFEFVNMVCGAIWKAIPEKENLTGKRDGRTRLMPNMIRGYFTDMDRVLQTMSEVMPSGSKSYIVVDQSAYVGVVVATDIMLAQLAENHDFTVERIIKCRRANTSGQQLKRFPYLKDILRESIVILQKK